MIDFDPTEDQRLVRDAVLDLSKTVLSVRMREVEEHGAIPQDLRATLIELGLAAASVPESLGGQNLGMVGQVLIEEELAAGDPSIAYGYPGGGSFGRCVMQLGDETQQATWVRDFEADGAVAWSEKRALSERAGFAATAVREGDTWRIRGTKSYIAKADTAEAFVVFAQVDDTKGWDGLGAFVVKKGPGVAVGARAGTLGLDAVFFADVTFDTTVDDSARLLGGGDLTRALVRFFLREAVLVAARCTGLSRNAVEVSRDYCDGRKAFGKPIGHFQAIAFKLADRLMDADSARWMVWRAAWAWDSGADEIKAMRYSAQAAAHAIEAAMRCGDDAVQLHGGAGFMRDYPVEKMMRDAKQMALTCPTVTQLDQIATALDLGLPFDPAVMLPTPEVQPIFT